MYRKRTFGQYVLILAITLVVAAGNSSCNSDSALSISDLTVEGRDSLSGTDILQPRLSWKLNSPARGLIQVAYQVEVASTKERLANGQPDLWNSGRIESATSVNLPYNGKDLDSYQNCYWRVTVWTNDSAKSISKPSYWSMGLLNQSDWKADWIGLKSFSKYDQPDSIFTRLAARYLRKEFDATKEVARATVYLSGLGLYELYLNGEKVGNDVLSPGVTEYDKRIFYNTYDVTSQIQEGKNCAAVLLGNGRYFALRNYQGKPDPLTGIGQRQYGLPKLLLQLRIQYTDGSETMVVSDPTWKVTADGPIVANNEYDGERYDATLEMAGWNRAGFDDTAWTFADTMPADSAQLTAQPNENIRVKEELKPVRIDASGRGTYIVDMGQNMVGWIHIRMRGEKGDTVQLRFAETMKTRDSLYFDNLRNARATDTYILKGGAEEQWEPRFTYHGFRYVEVLGLREKPSLDDLTGKVIYDDIATTGTFQTSDSTINAVFRNAYWTIRGNYRGMPTDCPQRDERVAWLGDRVMSSYGESFIFDNSRLYAKWLTDIADSQKPNGSLPDIAPSYWDRYADNVTYPSAFILIPEMLRKQFGDTISYRKHYSSMKKWIWYMWNTYREDDLVLKDNYGDWCVPPESLDMIWSNDPNRITNGGLLASAYYYHCLQLMKNYARMMNLQSDLDAFDEVAQKVKAAFQRKFYNAGTHSYSNNTVTANLLPLSFGLVPKNDREAVFQHIRDRLKEFDDHVNSGIIGGMWLMRGLTDNGRADLAYTLATNTTYPSWGYMVGKGATTIWELWNGDAANPMMNSGNHQMLLGDLLVWYYEYLAGIKSDSQEIGFKKIIMEPIFPEGLQFVNASLKTKYGLVESSWKKQDGKLEWTVTIPPNTTAEITLPAKELAKVTESGKAIPETWVEVSEVNTENNQRILVGSGSYHFEIQQ